MKKTLLAILLLISINSYSQLSKTHYIPPLSNSVELTPQSQFMYISTPSATAVNLKIIKIGDTIVTGTVSRDLPFVLNLGEGDNTQLIINRDNVNKVKHDKGFIVEADGLIYVSVRVMDYNKVHASSVVSKGMAALGTKFRIGAFTNKSLDLITDYHYTFASVLATENNTTVTFGDIRPKATLINNTATGSFSVTLNRGESYVMAVEGPNIFNSDALIGASISSDKPIAVNCGSFGGSNGTGKFMDLGFDQIVSTERTGQEYIFVKGNGTNLTERPLLIAHYSDTKIYLNGSTSSFVTLNAGDYITLDSSNFSSDGNLYVWGTKDFFAYQGIGGTTNEANQNMHFVPPLSCETPKIIDNIPFINEVGSNKDFTATANIVTEKGASLNFTINGTNYTPATMPSSMIKGPFAVPGTLKYVTYTLKGLKGNVSVISTKQVYLSYFGSSSNATYGGYYSGFAYKPEIDLSKDSCFPNIKLSLSELSPFEEFQWYLNGNAIAGATNRSYTPLTPGLYHVAANMAGCNNRRESDIVPVSMCPEDSDKDLINDNVDIDIDNDGIANCDESFDVVDLDLSGTTGTITKDGYVNSFNKDVKINGSATSFAMGGSEGTIATQITKGLNNSITQTFNFAKPISLVLEYVKANDASWLNSEGDFVVAVPATNTILVLNPDNQLLIDTNYDGIYESGVKEFSSFQIRFRLRDATKPLDAGTGKFKFLTRLVTSFSITHKNLSAKTNNQAIFRLGVTCLPKDSDGDGVMDENDMDDDNDGIPTAIEVLGKNYTNAPFIDANNNGMSDANEPGLGTLNSDNDGIPDYLDLDSDNDGIYDLTEARHNAADADNNGTIDGNAFGKNGFSNSLETNPDSGAINYTIANNDTDGYPNYIDSDSDSDGCYDVKEAGFSDPDGDGYLGNSSTAFDAYGKSTSGPDGYTPPSNNYITPAPIAITTQPVDQIAYPGKNVSFTISSNADSFQWQLSSDGTNYTDITDNATYTGSKTAILKVANATIAMHGYKYRVVLNRNGNSCDVLSSEAFLKLLVTSAFDFAKCDDDTDGFIIFNLKQKENLISDNATFTYFSTIDGALNKDSKFKIANPQAYNNSKGETVYVRVEKADGTFTVSQLNLIISVTQIAPDKVWNLYSCDDIDASNNFKDGISSFDFQSATQDIIEYLPGNATYSVKYYKNQKDAIDENDAAGNSLEIKNTSDYRNIGSPNSQTIWVRILSNIEDACVGLGPYLILNVNPLPNIELNHKDAICSESDSVVLDAGLLTNSNSDYSYTWSKDGQPIETADKYSYTADSAGTYTCIVKDPTTGCENTRTNTVANSKLAEIENVDISDLSVNNKVTVTATGLGDYEYSLDSETGPFQDSKTFEHVPPGFHVVYVNDKNGCGVVPEEIAVVGAPPFFTPNGDGIHETWKLEGVDSEYLKNSKVEIFDRYGKLLYVIPDATSEGWNGTYNGIPLPANDYWFAATLENGRVGKGHFTLKR